MTSKPSLYLLPGGKLDCVHPLRVPLLGEVQGRVDTQTYLKYLQLE